MHFITLFVKITLGKLSGKHCAQISKKTLRSESRFDSPPDTETVQSLLLLWPNRATIKNLFTVLQPLKWLEMLHCLAYIRLLKSLEKLNFASSIHCRIGFHHGQNEGDGWSWWTCSRGTLIIVSRQSLSFETAFTLMPWRTESLFFFLGVTAMATSQHVMLHSDWSDFAAGIKSFPPYFVPSFFPSLPYLLSLIWLHTYIHRFIVINYIDQQGSAKQINR